MSNTGRRRGRSQGRGRFARRVAAAIVLALLGAAAGFAYGTRAADSFSASATVLVSPLQGNAYSPDGTGDQLVNLETEARVVSSDAVASQVSQSVDGTASTGLVSNLSVTVPANTQILVIKYTAGSEDGARRHAQAFADSYLDFRKQRADQARSSQAAQIQSEIDKQNKSLDKLVGELRDETDRDQQGVLRAQIRGVTTQIGQFRNTLSELSSGPDDPGQVLTPAHIVARPPLSSRLVATVLGALVGLVLAGLLFLIPARSRTRVRGPDDVSMAGLPVLGRVPIRELHDAEDAAADPQGQPIGPGLGELRVALLSRERRRPVRLLVTGLTDDDQHPHSALPLAYSLARSELSTVLVDATPGAHGITSTLGLDDAPGFTEVLTHDLSLQRALHRLTPHLQVMPAGQDDAHAQDLLVSPSMASLLEVVQEHAEVVIVAAGPSNSAPTRALALAVDGVVVEMIGGRVRSGDLDRLLGEGDGRDWQITGAIYVDAPKGTARPSPAKR